MSKLASLFIGGDNSGPGMTPGEKPSYAILFVDDEPHVLKAMKRIFRKENYKILTADRGESALNLLKENDVQVVISDHRMPGMQGADLLRKIKSLYPNTIRIMLTGHADVQAVMGAINEGAVYKFITKPWNDDDLRVTVGLALEQYDLLKENVQLKKQRTEQDKKIKQLSRCFSANRSQLGRMLVKKGLLAKDALEKALQAQARSEKILPVVLKEMGLADEKTMMSVIESELKINRVNPAEFTSSGPLATLIPKSLCEKHVLVPLKKMGRTLLMAMADPTDLVKIDELQFLTGMPIKPVISSHAEILAKAAELYGDDDSLVETISKIQMGDPTETIEIILDEDDEVVDVDELLRAKDMPPAIRIVNSIISDALRHNASDVHIEPKNKHLLVRYRIDDLLHEKIRIPMAMHPSVVSRIKVMSELDITERRKPQDGRVTVRASTKTVDMRISSLPTVNGEKVVLRILDKSAASQDLEDLGLSSADLAKIRRFIKQPQGMVLATGPTGSGKTSSLYAMLRKGATITKNFTTIEDPVEYFMGMAEQVNVREKIGLDFPTILRSILRQDPNVIMLGEIRDFQTAEVAFHAALTGHLVLSTLHTNGSIASIIRLRDMGIKPYVMSEALTGIIAQRLLRKICTNCITEAPVSEEVLKSIKLSSMIGKPLKKGAGCEKCQGSGYKSRIGVFEVLEFDSEFRRMVHGEASDAELMRAATQANMRTILEDALDKVMKGVTTCDEVLRVLGPQNTLELSCPECNYSLTQRFNFCPSCATRLTRRCHNCDCFLESSWKACPHCGEIYSG